MRWQSPEKLREMNFVKKIFHKRKNMCYNTVQIQVLDLIFYTLSHPKLYDESITGVLCLCNI